MLLHLMLQALESDTRVLAWEAGRKFQVSLACRSELVADVDEAG
jgi:hypothetical protein